MQKNYQSTKEIIHDAAQYAMGLYDPNNEKSYWWDEKIKAETEQKIRK